MATLRIFDGWKRFVSDVDGGLIRDGLPIVTPDTPLSTNYPETLTREQRDQTGPVAKESEGTEVDLPRYILMLIQEHRS